MQDMRSCARCEVSAVVDLKTFLQVAHNRGDDMYHVSLDVLRRDGLIEEVESKWKLTEKGNKFLLMLQDVPYPVSELVWVDPRQEDNNELLDT